MEKFFLIFPLSHSESKEDSDLYVQELTALKRYADSSYEYEDYSKLFEILLKSATRWTQVKGWCWRRSLCRAGAAAKLLI